MAILIINFLCLSKSGSSLKYNVLPIRPILIFSNQTHKRLKLEIAGAVPEKRFELCTLFRFKTRVSELPRSLSYLCLQNPQIDLSKKTLVVTFNFRWVIKTWSPSPSLFLWKLTSFYPWSSIPLSHICPFSLFSATPFLIYDVQEHGWTLFVFIPYFSCI